MSLRERPQLPKRPKLLYQWLRLRCGFLPQRLLHRCERLPTAQLPRQLRNRRDELRALRSAADRSLPEWKLRLRWRPRLWTEPTVRQRGLQAALAPVSSKEQR